MNVPGDIHNGVHVVWVAKAVPEAHQAQREAVAAAGVEAMVHANIICAQVMLFNSCYILEGSRIMICPRITFD